MIERIWLTGITALVFGVTFLGALGRALDATTVPEAIFHILSTIGCGMVGFIVTRLVWRHSCR